MRENLAVIGRLTSVYGLQGWLKARSHTEPPENLFAYQPWLLSTDQGFKTTLIENWHRHNKGFVAKIIGVDNRQQASSLCALDIAIEKTLVEASSWFRRHEKKKKKSEE